MPNEDPGQATQSGRASPVAHQTDDVAHAAKRLYGRANRVAQTLLAVTYMRDDTPESQSTRDVVQKTYALAAILSNLLEDLMAESIMRRRDGQDMWTDTHHQSLLRCMDRCEDAFGKIPHQVRLADEAYHVTGVRAGVKYVDGLGLDNEQQVMDAVDECFGLVSKTKLILKHTAFARIESPDDGEIQEVLRIAAALQKPGLNDIWVLKDEPYASRRLQAILRPDRAAAVPLSAPIEPEAAPYVSEHFKPMWALSGWPLSAGTYGAAPASAPAYGRWAEDVRPAGVPPIGMHIPPSNHAPRSEPIYTSAPTPAGPHTVSFGEPSVITPRAPNNSFLGVNNLTSPFANWQLRSTPLTPAPHLEAYIIQPSNSISDTAFTLTYSVENLRLNEEAMQAHIQRLGSDYSVLSAISSLHPQVLNLIQSRAAQRHGAIVSIEHGKPSQIRMLMGSLEIIPTIFIISTTTMLPPASSSMATSAPVPNTFGSGPWATGTHKEQKEELVTNTPNRNPGGIEQFQSITANKEWRNQDRSFEEIRHADYNADRKGPLSGNQMTNPDSNQTGSPSRITAQPPSAAATTSNNNARTRFETAPSIWPPSLPGASLATQAPPSTVPEQSRFSSGTRDMSSISPFGLLAKSSTPRLSVTADTNSGPSFASPSLPETMHDAAVPGVTSIQLKEPEAPETSSMQAGPEAQKGTHDDAALDKLMASKINIGPVAAVKDSGASGGLEGDDLSGLGSSEHYAGTQ